MALFDLKKVTLAAAIGFVCLVIGVSDTSAQTRRQIERERQRIARENARLERQNQRRYRDRRENRVSERVINNSNYASGYEYGFMAGQYDRRKGKYNQSNVYRDTGAYPTAGDPTSSDYIYRQGYLQGYQDGFYGRRNF